jgi:hypothetical protein
MKLLTISDVVNNSVYNANAKTRFCDVDLVLSCGDLPAYYLEFIVSMLDVPLYYVVGNHADEMHVPDKQARRADPSLLARPGEKRALQNSDDSGDDDKPVGPYGCDNLDARIVNHKGLLIAGIQGSRWYNGGQYQYTEEQMSRRLLLLRPQLVLNRLRYGRALDILITHAPPAGIHDDVDVAHQGFRSFIQFMDDFAPRYLIHGHKHVYTHGETTVTQYKRTTVINTYGFRRLELEVTNP